MRKSKGFFVSTIENKIIKNALSRLGIIPLHLPTEGRLSSVGLVEGSFLLEIA
jgi:hypothetical protein